MTLFWPLVVLLTLPIFIFAIYPLLQKNLSVSFDGLILKRGKIYKRHIIAIILLVLVMISGSSLLYLSQSESYHQLIAWEKMNRNIDTFMSAIEKVENKLKNNPNDVIAWRTLARARIVLGQYTTANQAYAQLEQLGGLQEIDDLMHYAESLLAVESNPNKVQSLLSQVLEQKPENQKLAYLYGFLSFNKENYAQAIEHWAALKNSSTINLSAHVQHNIESMLDVAYRLNEQAKTKAINKNIYFDVAVSIHDDVFFQMHADDKVFIYAHATEGSAIPLAMKTLTVNDLPQLVRLHENDNMLEGVSMSQFEKIEIVARVSINGTAKPAIGDFYGKSEHFSTQEPAQTSVLIQHIVK